MRSIAALTETERNKIRRRVAKGESVSALAREFRVGPPNLATWVWQQRRAGTIPQTKNHAEYQRRFRKGYRAAAAAKTRLSRPPKKAAAPEGLDTTPCGLCLTMNGKTFILPEGVTITTLMAPVR